MVGLCALMVGEAVWSMRNDLIPTVEHHAVVVLSAVVMVLVGELVRVHMPSGRVLAPISSAVGFTLASLGAVQGSASFAVRPGVVILCYATGQVLAAALRREVDTTGGAAARLLSVGILVQLDAALGRGGGPRVRRVDRPRDRAIVDRHAPGAHPPDQHGDGPA